MTVVVLYLSGQCVQCSYDDEFVDPTDMLNYDRSTRSMKKPKPKTLNEPVQNDRCTVFLSRFIKMIITNTGLSKVWMCFEQCVLTFILEFFYGRYIVGDIRVNRSISSVDFKTVPILCITPFFFFSQNFNSDMKNNEQLTSRVSVTLPVQDLQLLENMVNNKDIDYIEIDRIINVMFSPDDFRFPMDNDYGETYNQVTRHFSLIIWMSNRNLFLRNIFNLLDWNIFTWCTYMRKCYVNNVMRNLYTYSDSTNNNWN